MNGFFTVDGKPFFALGGQAHNSTTYNPEDLEVFWQALDALHGNTAEIPVYWEAVEPQEGHFDFSQVDLLLAQARQHQKRLVLLWFATWKNGNMRYAPAWVKQDTQRFQRVVSHEGNVLFVLSSHCEENRLADEKAFCALMAHLKATDQEGTVLAVQIENEAGIAGRSYRDFGQKGQEEYDAPVPQGLLDAIAAAPESQLHAQWQAQGTPCGKGWGETFGVKNGAENLTAYSVASYINSIAQAGRRVYDIPLYTNVALDQNPWGWNLAGTNYTAGGPIPRLYEIWKHATPALDLLAPDIYFNCTSVYTRVCRRYSGADNPLFVPESSSRGDGGNAKNMFYAIGTYGAIGYAAFGIESILDSDGRLKPESRELADSFCSVSKALPLLVKHRGSGAVHTVVQEEFEEGYFYETEKYIIKIDYAKDGYGNFIHSALGTATSRARGLVIQDGPDDFYILGMGFTAYFAPKDDIFFSEDRVSNHMPYLLVEEGAFTEDGQWQRRRTRTGDECDHGIWMFPENGVVHVALCP